jgi:hypothetical protein
MRRTVQVSKGRYSKGGVFLRNNGTVGVHVVSSPIGELRNRWRLADSKFSSNCQLAHCPTSICRGVLIDQVLRGSWGGTELWAEGNIAFGKDHRHARYPTEGVSNAR